MAKGAEETETAGMAKGAEETETAGMAKGAEETETAGMAKGAAETETADATETMGAAGTAGIRSDRRESSSTKSRRAVMLDVRSDIYSLGATLYHLLSGNRPSQKADAVQPLGTDSCSSAVAAIIEKAMAAEPEQRYQSAEEMLTAFLQLPVRDGRAVRHRHRIAAAACLLSLLFLAGGASTFIGLKQMEQRQTALALAEYSADELAKGNVSGAVELALQAIPDGKSILEAPVTAEARKVLTDALGVYELADSFQPLDVTELPSAPYQIQLSPDGRRFAAVCQGSLLVFDTESRVQQAKLPIVDSALADVLFTDNDRILYAGNQGVTLYDLKEQKEIWTGEEATTLAVSRDGRVAAAVNRDVGQAVLYSMEDGSVLSECSFYGKQMETAFNDIFANPANRIFELNQDGTMLAVSFSDGGLTVYDLRNPEADLIVYEESAFSAFDGGFCGKYFAFAARKSDQSLFGLIDTEEAVYAGELESRSPMRLRTDETGIWLSEGNLLVRFDPETLEDTEMAFTDQWNISGFDAGGEYLLVTTDDPGFSFFDSGAHSVFHEQTEEAWDFLALAGDYGILANRNQPSVRLMKLESHEDADVLSYDARYAHDEARLSGDGSSAILFNYQGFRIYDRDGGLLAEGEFPDAEQIYDQQYRREDGGEWLEVIWYDGTVRTYDPGDGGLLSETKGDPPEKDLYEEFVAGKYRFASELHGTPKVYDRKSGRLVKELEKDSYLTYVTETGPYIVTEYVNADGERYGLLLDDKLQTLAYLPRLCDITGGMAVFDYGTGDLRQCRLYSLQELIALGESYIKTPKGEMR